MIRRRVPAMLAAGLMLTGCGIEPTGPLDGGDAPTGVAPGPTLYFVDARGNLVPSVTPSERLGEVTNAVDLLLRVGDQNREGLHSDLPTVDSLGPQVTIANTTITVDLPLARSELGPRGVDQVSCTALGVRRQSGDSRVTHVVVNFTVGRRTEPRTCPAP
ncbi:hypothetical protein [Amycolatopsis cihanbeyliensis]|uniref:Sporulation and spore germination protein n=1 Tax=Amycolatopsis cihanbeyliensis TaxID=1128664 RepID=A0A542DFB0_AMYCI|nr:hypothetical protein [Amycolatopsis cihanbeyliensis]TQJ01765.1 hypothetical protein FB471_1479 [Amycolatopsis cihanbeyliensis]